MKLNLQIQRILVLKIVPFLTVLLLCCIPSLQAQTQQLPQGNITTTGTYTVPAGVTKIKIEAVGGGGAGGRSTINGEATAGGGGGAYSRLDACDVTSGDVFNIVIGTGGTCKSAGSVNGGTTTITKGGITIITANGGTTAPINGQASVAGGVASVGYSASFAGGSGGSANKNTAGVGSNSGAGGGGSAGWTTKNGNNGNPGYDGGTAYPGVPGTGGSGDGYLAGSGGAGVRSETSGNAGGNYGGGGGGVKRANALGNNWDGGGGAQGVVKITFLCTTEYALSANPASSLTQICQNAAGVTTNITFTGTTANLPAGTYEVTYTVNGVEQTPQNVTVNASGTGVINNVSIPTYQAGNVSIAITYLKNTASPYCENDIFANNTVTIIVKPLPEITLTKTATVCSEKEAVPDPGLSATLNGIAYDEATYNIEAVASSNNITGHTLSGMGLPAFYEEEVLTNNGIIPGTVTYTITPVVNECLGTPREYAVTVNPIPEASFTNYTSEEDPTSADETICTGTAVLDPGLSSTVEGTTYMITSEITGEVTGNTNASDAGSFTTLDVLVNTSETVAYVTYTVIPTANGCVGTPIYLRVTVNPEPEVTNDLTNQVLCNEEATEAIVFEGVANAFEWIASGDVIEGIPEGLQNGEFGPYIVTNTTDETLTATITVTPIFDGNTLGVPCKGDSKSFTITVNPVPQASISKDMEVCDGTPVTLTFILTAGTPPWSVTYQNDQGGDPITLDSEEGESANVITAPITPSVGTTIYEIIRITDNEGCINNDPE